MKRISLVLRHYGRIRGELKEKLKRLIQQYEDDEALQKMMDGK